MNFFSTSANLSLTWVIISNVSSLVSPANTCNSICSVPWGGISLLLSRFLTTLVTRDKDPLNINSPLPGVVATAFVFIATLLSSQLLSDVSAARQSLHREVASIQNIRFHAELLSANEREHFEKLLNGYVMDVVNNEWGHMQGSGQGGDKSVRHILQDLLRFTYKLKDCNEKDAIKTSLNELMSARVERLRIAADTVPELTWVIMFGLSFFMLVTIWINHGNYHQWQLLVGITVVILSSLVFIMLFSHDQPYARADIVDPRDLINALK